MDKLEKPHELQPISFEDIPTPEEHSREVRKIFVTCGVTAATVVLGSALAIGLSLWNGVPLQKLALVVPIVMAIAIVTFGVGYGIPVGLVSLRRLEIAYRMGYFGVHQSKDATKAMKEIADRVRRDTAPIPASRRPVSP